MKQTLKILLIEDHPDEAMALAELLEMTGYEIKVAYDGKSALELAISFLPDIIFLDILLPDMTGFEIAALIRGYPQLKNCKVIALTGYSHQIALNDTRAAGFYDHLVKPINFEEVDKLLQSLPD